MTRQLKIIPHNPTVKDELVYLLHGRIQIQDESKEVKESHHYLWGADPLNCDSCSSSAEAIIKLVAKGFFGDGTEVVLDGESVAS